MILALITWLFIISVFQGTLDIPQPSAANLTEPRHIFSADDYLEGNKYGPLRSLRFSDESGEIYILVQCYPELVNAC